MRDWGCFCCRPVLENLIGRAPQPKYPSFHITLKYQTLSPIIDMLASTTVSDLRVAIDARPELALTDGHRRPVQLLLQDGRELQALSPETPWLQLLDITANAALPDST